MHGVAVGELSPPDRSCGAIEQVGDDDGLAPDIMTVNLSKLSLPGVTTRLAPRRTLAWTKREQSRRSTYLVRLGSCWGTLSNSVVDDCRDTLAKFPANGDNEADSLSLAKVASWLTDPC